MKLNENSWHVKWYFLSTALFEAWKGNEPPMFFNTPIETNLCPYMRRILWTFPWMLAFYASVVFLVFNAAIYYPLAHFGWSYVWMVLSIVGGVAAFIGICIGISAVFPAIGQFLNTYIGEPLGRFIERVATITEDCIMGQPDAPSFCAIMRQWLIDRHHQICRNIQIGE
jgi:hypothetical protein